MTTVLSALALLYAANVVRPVHSAPTPATQQATPRAQPDSVLAGLFPRDSATRFTLAAGALHRGFTEHGQRQARRSVDRAAAARARQSESAWFDASTLAPTSSTASRATCA